ncbi:hypothetical protein LguiB_031278 [Lonicera macranthoides]
MATNSSIPARNQTPNPPPKRGKIKAQIFESIGETIITAASKAGEALGLIKKEGGGGGSVSTSSNPSAYNSDGST